MTTHNENGRPLAMGLLAMVISQYQLSWLVIFLRACYVS
jgi:light-regulated signal transduction histidine kinase (bacteriophytochrome)